ncbi:MAG: GUN4 domain-containing protein [Cyanobacteriota bacterium]|nr:GUN4 domain-containing protein [Cyanobacteriota bacterium]
MQNSYYTYRIKIENKQDVKVEKLDLNDRVIENPSGKLRLDKLTNKVRKLLQLSKSKQLNDSRQSKLLGEALFDSLFDDVLCQNFIDFYDLIIRKEQKRIRIELDINEKLMPELAALPWEFMCLPQKANSGSVWLAAAPDLVFSRRRTQCKVAEPISLQPNEKLRIALVIAAPQDLNRVVYEKVKVELEKLAREQAHRVKLLPIVESANPKAVDSILRQKPHIFHFIGHGRLQDENHQDIGQIAFVDDVGNARWVDADYFSSLFARYCRGIVVLQACEGGALSESQAFVGLASRVVQQNVPVVVAMQYEVSNSTASQFTCRFYKELAEGKPVDIAAQEGRYEIVLGSKGYEQRDFATPVIFMQVPDGNLFQWKEGEGAVQLTTPWIIALIIILSLFFIIIRNLLVEREPLHLEETPTEDINTDFSTGLTDIERALKQRAWESADSKTSALMLKIGDIDNNGKLYKDYISESKEINDFPCEYLQKINELWVHHSNGKFGFSVQKEIYLSLGAENQNLQEIWNTFIEKGVGWHSGEKWLPFHESVFKDSAPKGHLPRLQYINDKDGLRYVYFKDKLEECNL